MKGSVDNQKYITGTALMMGSEFGDYTIVAESASACVKLAEKFKVCPRELDLTKIREVAIFAKENVK